MKNSLISTLLILVFTSVAWAQGEICHEALESLARAKHIPFEFKPGTDEMKNATNFDRSKNPKTFQNQDHVTLKVFSGPEAPSRFVLTQETNCEKSHCHTLSLKLDTYMDGRECRILNAEVESDGILSRTLYSRDACHWIKNMTSKSILNSADNKPEVWMKTYKLRKKASEKIEDFVRQFQTNCRIYEKYFESKSKATASTPSSAKPADSAK